MTATDHVRQTERRTWSVEIKGEMEYLESLTIHRLHEQAVSHSENLYWFGRMVFLTSEWQ